jgi:hypothetical protein
MTEENNHCEADVSVGPKKMYHSPQLTCYGAVAEITATVHTTGNADGNPHGSASKTH